MLGSHRSNVCRRGDAIAASPAYSNNALHRALHDSVGLSARSLSGLVASLAPRQGTHTSRRTSVWSSRGNGCTLAGGTSEEGNSIALPVYAFELGLVGGVHTNSMGQVARSELLPCSVRAKSHAWRACQARSNPFLPGTKEGASRGSSTTV